MEKSVLDIVRNFPIGTRLWCDVLGEVEYIGINEGSGTPIAIKGVNTGYLEYLTMDGRFYDTIDTDLIPCILWPSETHRSWDGWENVINLADYKVGDWIVYGNGCIGKVTKIENGKVYLVDQDGHNCDICYGIGEYKWSIENACRGDILVDKRYGDIVVVGNLKNKYYFNALNALVVVQKDELDGKVSVTTNVAYDNYNFVPADEEDIAEFKNRLAKLDMFWDGEKVVKYDIGTILEHKRTNYQVQIEEVLDDYVNVSGDGCLFGDIEKKYLDKYWKFVQ